MWELWRGFTKASESEHFSTEGVEDSGDAPGGGGKVPINPEYIQDVTENEIIFRNFQGKTYRYPLGGADICPPSGFEEIFEEVLS